VRYEKPVKPVAENAAVMKTGIENYRKIIGKFCGKTIGCQNRQTRSQKEKKQKQAKPVFRIVFFNFYEYNQAAYCFYA
jgi:hypothetical protein